MEAKLDPRRSPDSHYVAYDTIAEPENEKILLDLKTRKRYVMFAGSCKAIINWIPNGSEVWFDACAYKKAALYAYSVKTHTLREVDESKRGKIRYKGYRINPKTKKIYIHGFDENRLDIVGIFTLNWEKIKAIPFRHFSTNFDISPDGNRMITGFVKNAFAIYDLSAEKAIFQQKRQLFEAIFSENGQFVYAAGAHNIKVVDGTTGKISRSIDLPDGMYTKNLDLYNY